MTNTQGKPHGTPGEATPYTWGTTQHTGGPHSTPGGNHTAHGGPHSTWGTTQHTWGSHTAHLGGSPTAHLDEPHSTTGGLTHSGGASGCALAMEQSGMGVEPGGRCLSNSPHFSASCSHIHDKRQLQRPREVPGRSRGRVGPAASPRP